MVNHGISTGALFLLVGMIYERRHTREIAELEGLQKAAPILAGVFTVVMLSLDRPARAQRLRRRVPDPLGTFLTRRWWAVVAAAGVILAALYLLWAYQRVFHGEPDEDNADIADLTLARGPGDGPAPRRSSCSSASTRSRCSTASSRRSTALIAPRRGAAPTTRSPTVADAGGAERRRSPSRAPRRGGARDDRATPSLAGPGRRASSRSTRPTVDWSAPAPAPHPARRRRRAAGARSPRCPAAAAAGWHAVFTVVAAGAGRSSPAIPLWYRVQRRRARSAPSPARVARRRLRRVPRRGHLRASVILAALLADGYLRREELEGPELYVLMLLSASGGVIMAVGQRPHRAVPRPRDPLDRRLRPGRHAPAPARSRRRRPSSTSCSAPSPRRSSSTASPSSTAPPARPTSTEHRRRSWPTTCSTDDGLLLAGFALLLVGLGFKVAAVPFHSGRPTCTRARPRRSSPSWPRRVKAAGFAGLLRVFVVDLRHLPARLAADRLRARRAHAARRAVLAVVQTDVKRMLAYSSISHAGFILIGVEAATDRGHRRRRSSTWSPTRSWSPAPSASSPWSAARATAHHASTTTGAWPRARPLLALAFTVFLLAQAGVPLTSGSWPSST